MIKIIEDEKTSTQTNINECDEKELHTVVIYAFLGIRNRSMINNGTKRISL